MMVLTQEAKSPPVAPNGTFFSGVFTDHAVLQRAPATSAVYGYVSGGVSSDTQVVVTVTEYAQSNPAKVLTSYNITAEITDTTYIPANISWKAFLTAHEAGGNVSISASCKNCGNTSSVAEIDDITFGDVFICSGQSNMWLPMQYAFTRNRTFSLLDSGAAYGNIR